MRTFLLLCVAQNSGPSSTITSSGPIICNIPANPDLLGIGVRFGIYFQLAANMLITAVRPEEGISSLTISNIFYTGNLIGVIYSLVHTGIPPGVMPSVMSFLAIDVSLLFPIGLLAFSSDEKVHLSFLTVAFIMLRWLASIYIAIWFWFRGLYIANHLQCKEPRVFFFANFGAYGGIRTVFKVFAVISAAVFTLIILPYILYQLYDRLFVKKGSFEDRFELNFAPPPAAEGDPDAPVGPQAEAAASDEDDFPLILKAAIAIGALVGLLSAAATAIELQIKWNNLTGLDNINSVGQIVPLTIGCFGLFRTVMLVALKATRKPGAGNRSN
jgi:hypothetical protein